MEIRGRGSGGQADIKNLVTGWADKIPEDCIAIFSEHGMKTIPVAAQRAGFEFFRYFDLVDPVVHNVLSRCKGPPYSGGPFDL
jgi:hypothetical protein